MNFWQGFMQNNFDQIFDDENLTLEKVLENDQVIMEFRNRNRKLVDFLKQNIQNLIDYVMTDNLTNNTKYAFVSAEILQFENDQLISWFFPESDDVKEISLDLHDIREKSVKKNKQQQNKQEADENQEDRDENIDIENEEVNNDEEKNNLNNNSSEEYINENISNEDNIVQEIQSQQQEYKQYFLLDCLFNHLEKEVNITSAGYFNKIFSNLYKNQSQQLLEYILKSQSIISNLIKNMSYFAIGEVIQSIIIFENYENQEQSDLMNERQQVLEQVFSLLMNSESSEVVNNCENIMIEIFMKEQFTNRSELINQIQNNKSLVHQLLELVSDDSRPHQQRVSVKILELMLNQQLNIKDIVGKYLINMVDYIKEGKKNIQKYRVIQLIIEIIKLEDKKMNQGLAMQNLVMNMVRLVEENKNNNLIQIQVDKLINTILNGDSFILIMQLTNNPQLHRVLIDNYQQQDHSSIRLGHLGFIIQLGQKILNFINENSLPITLEPTLLSILKLENDRQNLDFTKTQTNPDQSYNNTFYTDKAKKETLKAILNHSDKSRNSNSKSSYLLSSKQDQKSSQEFLQQDFDNDNQQEEEEKNMEQQFDQIMQQFDQININNIQEEENNQNQDIPEIIKQNNIQNIQEEEEQNQLIDNPEIIHLQYSSNNYWKKKSFDKEDTEFIQQFLEQE